MRRLIVWAVGFPSCDLEGNASLFHLFVMWCSGNCGSGNCGCPICDRKTNNAADGECRDFRDARECLLRTLDNHHAVNFLRSKCLDATFLTGKLSFRKSSFETVFLDVAVSGLNFRPESCARRSCKSVATHRWRYRCIVVIKGANYPQI